MDSPLRQHPIFLSFYGDDFTGSTDVMESMALNGIPTALFLQVPAEEEVNNFRLKIGVGATPGSHALKAFGVAGVARSWSPEQMDQHLPSIFEGIRKIPSDFFQYKVCSTFDSSPEVGSIGHATELALQTFPSSFIPLIVGAPFLNRFLVFGNLFARVQENTYRLDRHPTMRHHPITPMTESDLRLHLSQQSTRPIELLDKFGLEGKYGKVEDRFRQLTEKKGNFLLFDTLEVEHLYTIGRLLIEHSTQEAPQLLVGASSANYALAFHLQQMGLIHKPTDLPQPGKAERMIVLAGSCSPVTDGQLAYMESLGHVGIRMDSLRLIASHERQAEIDHVFGETLQILKKGKVPLIYTARGHEDPVVQQTRTRLQQAGVDKGKTGDFLAGAQGKVAHRLISELGKMRVVVAGGDTSGYVAQALGIYALETLCPIAPGAPLCVAHSRDERFDGLEISLKGGQNGNEKYFASILAGKALD